MVLSKCWCSKQMIRRLQGFCGYKVFENRITFDEVLNQQTLSIIYNFSKSVNMLHMITSSNNVRLSKTLYPQNPYLMFSSCAFWYDHVFKLKKSIKDNYVFNISSISLNMENATAGFIVAPFSLKLSQNIRNRPKPRLQHFWKTN